MMARLGRNEQLVIVGGAAVAVSLLLGVIIYEWTFDLMYWLMVLGGLAAVALVFGGGDRMYGGYRASTLIRIIGAVIGAYGLVDFGDLLSSFGQWEPAEYVLTIVEVVGAGVLAYGAWAVSGGSLSGDAMAAGGAMRTGMADRFVYLGAVGVVVGWFLLMAIADVFNITVDAQIAILAAVLVLTVRWLARNPGAGALPVPVPWTIAVLGAVAVLLGLWWFARVIGDVLDFGDLTTYIPMLIYLLALASLAVGAFLGLGDLQARTGGSAAGGAGDPMAGGGDAAAGGGMAGG